MKDCDMNFPAVKSCICLIIPNLVVWHRTCAGWLVVVHPFAHLSYKRSYHYSHLWSSNTSGASSSLTVEYWWIANSGRGRVSHMVERKGFWRRGRQVSDMGASEVDRIGIGTRFIEIDEGAVGYLTASCKLLCFVALLHLDLKCLQVSPNTLSELVYTSR